MMPKDSIINFLFYAYAFLVNHLNPSCPVTLKGCQSSNSLYYTELFLKLQSDVQVWAILFFLQSKVQPSHFWNIVMKQSQYVPIFKVRHKQLGFALWKVWQNIIHLFALRDICQVSSFYSVWSWNMSTEKKYNLFNNVQIIYTALMHVQRVYGIYVIIKIIYWYTF